jgi:transposase
MQERIEMSEQEVSRLEVLSQVADGRLSQRKAGERLGLSERQVRRLLRGYEARGAQALVSQRRGRASNRRIAAAIKSAILARVQDCYADFGPTLAVEYLRAEGYRVSKETLRQWLMEAGQWKAKPDRHKRRHPPRLRRPCVGEWV